MYHGIGYPPDSEKQKKAVKKFEKKVDDALIEAIDEVTESELPEDESYTPVPETRKEPIPTAESYTYPRDKAVALKALKRSIINANAKNPEKFIQDLLERQMEPIIQNRII